MTNYQYLWKAVDAIRPLAFQVLLFGYIAAFQLPIAMIRYLGVGGNYSFLSGGHKLEYSEDRSAYHPQLALALTMGPGEAECQTMLHNAPERYSEPVLARARHKGAFFINFVSYYRDGLAFDKWKKSTSTLAALHNIESEKENLRTQGGRLGKRRSSSASPDLHSENHTSSLKAPTTMIWGEKDEACTEPICLHGIGDYLPADSQVLVLPETGHWTPIGRKSRETLKAILERLVQKGDVDKKDLLEIARETYPSAHVRVDK